VTIVKHKLLNADLKIVMIEKQLRDFPRVVVTSRNFQYSRVEFLKNAVLFFL